MKEWLKIIIAIGGTLALIGLFILFLLFVPFKVQYYILMSVMGVALFISVAGAIYSTLDDW